jgi:hypothetical protein
MTATETGSLTAATERLRRARDLRDVTEPLRRLLAQTDEDTRAAAQAAATAGLAERMIATLAGVSQPAVHGWLDDRRGAPLPAPSLAAEVWGLHTVTSALRGLVARLEGQHLARTPPTTHHATPVDAAQAARKALDEAAEKLAQLGAALDYAEGPGK